MKKYKLTDNRQNNLYQIQALIDIPKFNVKAGDLGGWIQKESNLSHIGNAWVSDDARVYDDAWVSGDARISDNAWIYGYANVYGDAWVSGDANVYGNAFVFDKARIYNDAWVSGDARVFDNAWIFGGHLTNPLIIIKGTKSQVHLCDKDAIKIGCEVHSINKWLINYEEIGLYNRFTQSEIEEYKAYIHFIADHISKINFV